MRCGTLIAVAASTLAVAGGCGGRGGDANVPTIAVERAPATEAPITADPWLAFSDVVFSGGRAMIAAVRGVPHDARWDCEGSADTDLRATPPGHRTVFQKSGARGDPVLYVLRGFELAWPEKGDGGDRWRSVAANLVIRPNGGARWADVTTQSADVEELMPVAELPAALRGALTALTTKLSSAACGLPGPSPGELEAAQMTPDAPDHTTEMLQGRVRGEENACKELRGATGPWRVGARRLVLALRGEDHGVTLSSAVVAPNGRICLGPVVVR